VALNAKPEASLQVSLRAERAAAFLETKDFKRAELDCRQAIVTGGDGRSRAALARCLLERGEASAAVAEAEAALDVAGESAESWRVLARALSADKRHARAIEAAQRARQRDAGSASRRVLLSVLAQAGRDDELIAFAATEIDVAASDPGLWYSLGTSLSARGRSDEAIAAFRRALSLAPGRVDASCGLALALLRLGHFAEGFRYYEQRQKNAGNCRRYGVPPWRGEALAGKHVIVWSEQGFGDTLQFVRFLPKFRQLAERTTLFAALPLLRLLRSQRELGTVETQNPGFGAGDFQTLLMSLPHLLQLGSDVGTGALPLFRPDPERVLRWRARLPAGAKIALAWQGNPKYAGEPWRSMPFSHYEPLLERFGNQATFVSLQKHVGVEQLRRSPCARRVLDLSDEIDGDGDAFIDSLAILSLVDVFLTTDSALAHLAGSANIRAWVLLSEVADWRWGAAGERWVWYPTLRLFRQRVGADWKGLVDDVAVEIEKLLASVPPAPTLEA
jgi:tetratricopeptide (TPR) repeat protein